MITKTKQKELEKVFGDTETRVLISYANGEFEKNGVNNNCRILAEKYGGAMSTYKKTHSYMQKYGTYEKHFPEKQTKNKYIQVSFRMSEELHKELKAKSYKLNKSLNKLITQAVKRSLR